MDRPPPHEDPKQKLKARQHAAEAAPHRSRRNQKKSHLNLNSRDRLAGSRSISEGSSARLSSATKSGVEAGVCHAVAAQGSTQAASRHTVAHASVEASVARIEQAR